MTVQNKTGSEGAEIKSFLRSWQKEADLGGRSLGINVFLICFPRGHVRSQEASPSLDDAAVC